MIKSIRLTNFFSFREEEIQLDRAVNLLIGINGSGKSNLFRAIELLKKGVEGDARNYALRPLIIDEWGGFDGVFFAGTPTPSDSGKDAISLEFIFSGNDLSGHEERPLPDITYKITVHRQAAPGNYYISETIRDASGKTYLEFSNGAGKIMGIEQKTDTEAFKNGETFHPQELALSKIPELYEQRFRPLISVKRAISDIDLYMYFDTSPNSKIRRAVKATSAEKKLLPDGGNLPQILNTIKIRNKPFFHTITQKLNDVNPMFSGFDFNILGSGLFELMLEEARLQKSIPVTHISDGTLRYLFLLAIFYNPNRGRLICIDEPETGLHPDMIYNIANAIKEASGKTTFLIATHNENVLDAFDLSNIRIFEKEEDNSTRIFQHNQEAFAGWYESFSPGKMWRAGDLGGKRW